MGEEGEEMTHLCDTCKYREEECKPRNARIVAGDVTECDGYEEELKPYLGQGVDVDDV